MTSLRSLPLAVVVMAVLLAACEQVAPPAEARRVPVYQVTGGPLNDGEAGELLAALGVVVENGAIDAHLGDDGSLFYLDTERFQYLPTVEGQSAVTGDEEDGVYSEFMFDLPGIRGLAAAPEIDAAIALVEQGLRAASRHPDGYYAIGQDALITVVPGHSRFELLDEGFGAVIDAELDTHVALEIALAADVGFLDLVGQGASIKVVLDAEGPTLIHYEFLQLERGEPVSVIAETDAVDACAARYSAVEAMGDGANLHQLHVDVRAELVYYAPALESAPSTVFPYYRCSGTKQFDDGTDGMQVVDLRTVLIKATDGAPDIVLPPGATLPERPEDGVDVTAHRSAFGVHDAGTQWVGESDGLSGSRRNAGRFYDTFAAVANVEARFNWGDHSAWERDFKDPIFGGNDTNWIDDVDVAFYTGHANGNGFTFTSTMHDGFLHFDEARWGNHDLEWLVIAACGPLQATTGGLSWAQRWGPSFHGLHLLMAYANVSSDNEVEGRIFARAILGVGEAPKRIRQAWVKAATTVQASKVTYAVMGVGTANGTTNWNDFFWGRGSGGGPDIPNGQIAYYWRLSGPS